MKMVVYANKPSKLMPWKLVKVPKGEQPEDYIGELVGPFESEFEANKAIEQFIKDKKA